MSTSQHLSGMTELNKGVVRRLYDEVFTNGRLEIADELIAPDCVDRHDDLDRRGPGRVKEVAAMLLAAFPDQQWEIHRLVAEGEYVAMYSTWSATNQGSFMGRAATGKRVSVPHMYLLRITAGQVTEYTAVRDDAAMMRQLAG